MNPLCRTQNVYGALKGVHLRVYSLLGNVVIKIRYARSGQERRLHAAMVHATVSTYLCQAA